MPQAAIRTALLILLPAFSQLINTCAESCECRRGVIQRERLYASRRLWRVIVNEIGTKTGDARPGCLEEEKWNEM